MLDLKNILDGWIYLDKENPNVAHTMYLHVHRFEALPSIICRSISCGQAIQVFCHKLKVRIGK